MLDTAALVQEQRDLATRVRVVDDLGPSCGGPRESLTPFGHRRRRPGAGAIFDDHPEPRVVAGFDVAYDGDTAFGALVFVDVERLAVLESVTASAPAAIPYIPGLLAYRELPALRAAWARRPRDPEVLLFDGAGIMHPRRLGIASHAGVLLDVPTLGVTKSLLCGRVEGRLEKTGDVAPVRDGGDLLGHAFRSSPRASKPVYVSPGHRVSHDGALALVQRLCTGKHKLPLPIAEADRLAGAAKRPGTGQQRLEF